jgi:hypothetical protein
MQWTAPLRHLCHVGATLGADARRFGVTLVRSRTAETVGALPGAGGPTSTRHGCDPTGVGLARPGFSLPRRAPRRAARHLLIRWHRQAFGLWWQWRSRPPGLPATPFIGHRLPANARVVARSVLGRLHHAYGLELAA